MDGIFRKGLLASAAIVCVATAGPAMAQTRTFNVPAQDASAGVSTFARQSDLQILISARDARGRRTNAVRGNFSVQEGLNRLLAGTGLRAQATGAQTYSVVPTGAAGNAAEEEDEGAEAGATPEILVVGSRSQNADIRRGEDDIQPYVVLDREDIERSGAADLEGFIRQRVTAQTESFTSSQSGSPLGSTSQINLRGLGSNQTLILVDGRRLASLGIQGEARQPDINGIPLAAIERIEVLPTTAGGIYGGSATGGVVNIVLRRDYRGLEITASYGNTSRFDRHTFRIDAAGGLTLNGGAIRIMASGSYSEAGDLLIGERDLLQRGRARILANNPSSFLAAFLPPLGATTNIRTLGGENLTLRPAYGGASLGSSFTSVPVGYPGPASDLGQGLISRAGRFNLDPAATAQFNGGARRSLLNAPRTWAFDVSVQQDIATGVEAYAEVQYIRNEGSYLDSATSIASFFVDASAPANPFNEAVFVTLPLIGADQELTTTNSSWRLLGGLRFDITAGWRGTLEYVWTRGRFGATTPSGSLIPDPGVDIASGALDVFRDVNVGPIDFSAYTTPPSRYGPANSTQGTATLRLSGPLGFRLPGGMPTATVLGEHRRERLDAFRLINPADDQIAFERSQRISAAYVEILAPLVAAENDVPLIRSLELQLAARVESYDIRGSNLSNSFFPTPEDRRRREFSSVNPTIGLKWTPVAGVTARASFATGFLPPALNQLSPNPAQPFSPAFLALLDIRDPARGNEIIGGGGPVAIISGGNPDLDPERSTSWAVGVILTPAFLPGFRFSADWTRIRKRDNIANFVGFTDPVTLAQSLLYAPERFPRNTDPATFGPYSVGPVTAIDTTLINIARARIEALDFAISYAREISAGTRLTFDARATRAIQNESQLVADSPVIDNIGLINGLKWRGVGSVTLETGNLTLSWTASYYGPYRVNAFFVPDQGAPGVRAQAYHDLYVGYRLPQGIGPARNAEIRLSVNNIFDRRPPFDGTPSSGAYYSFWGSPLRTNFNLSARIGF